VKRAGAAEGHASRRSPVSACAASGGPAIFPSPENADQRAEKMNAIGSEQAKSTDLDRFVSEENIARYRILFDPKTDDSQRRTILRLLKQEYVKLHDRPATTASKFER